MGEELRYNAAPAPHDLWKSFEDLLAGSPAVNEAHELVDEDPELVILPVFGIRIVRCVDGNGHTQLRWDITGGADVISVLGMLSQTAFLYQMHDIAHGGADLEFDVEDEEGEGVDGEN